MTDQGSTSEKPAAGWRLKLGAGLFVLSIVVPAVGVPVVATFDLSGTVTATVSGALLVAAEIFGVAAIAIMGKSGYMFIKNRVLGFLKKYGPPREVSRRRYAVGLVMFCVPILFGWLSLYAPHLIPGFLDDPLPYALGGDLLLVASLFVLGGNFWDKIRSLFVYDAEVRFAQTPHAGGQQ
jgi:hypothetical protein